MTAAAATFRVLVEYGRKAETESLGLDPRDTVSHLTEAKRAGWTRILSSVATTEGTEETLMVPLREAHREWPEVEEYLETHQRDEARHSGLLKTYLKNTFRFEKRAATFSDRIVYDGIFPQLSKLFLRKPVYGLAMLYFIETYGVGFYSGFKARAKADGLDDLVRLLDSVEKDERRHLAGLKAILKLVATGPLGIVDRTMIHASLRLMELDISMSPWAVHNRAVRRHALAIGLEPASLARNARDSISKTMRAFAEGPSDVG